MAYAQYARGAATLAGAGIRNADDLAVTAFERLARVATRGTDGAAWGLNFAWREDETAPYTVTTAIAGLALLDVHHACGAARALALADDAARWLTLELPWRRVGDGAAPRYSPHVDLVLPNVASLTGGFLARIAAQTGSTLFRYGARAALRFVVDAQLPSGAWTYGGGADDVEEPVVDLVHSAYTIDGLLVAAAALPELECVVRPAVAAGLRLVATAFFRPDGSAAERLVLRRDGLVQQPAESRLWGYAAALAAARRASRAGYAADDLAAALERRIMMAFTTDVSGRFPYRPGDRRYFPRHESHLFEALALSAVAPSTPL